MTQSSDSGDQARKPDRGPNIRFAPSMDPPPIVHGDPKHAMIEVEVFEIDGELDYSVRCMCSACYEIQEIGIEEALGDVEPGVYYMRSWFIVHPSGPWGPEEYEGGLEIANPT